MAVNVEGARRTYSGCEGAKPGLLLWSRQRNPGAGGILIHHCNSDKRRRRRRRRFISMLNIRMSRKDPRNPGAGGILIHHCTQINA
jgi:hypothetical protein